MSAPKFNILTQRELTIDLSRPAMEQIIVMLEGYADIQLEPQVQCEVDNFKNTLYNLLERSEPKSGNLDLVGG